MCTVSFIFSNGNYFITSNRDEHVSRPRAFAPVNELHFGVKLTFPKDPKAGGTWFASNENGLTCVLLNGAFRKHESTAHYERSRGLVVLEICAQPSPTLHFSQMNLTRIEPFTLIAFDGIDLTEMRWDGHQKHSTPLDSQTNYIWSSATLYSTETIESRENLFAKFLLKTPSPSSQEMIQFHFLEEKGNDLGFVIHRNSQMHTYSITQVAIQKGLSTMYHHDLFSDERSLITLQKHQSIER